MQGNGTIKSGMLYDVIDQSDDFYSCPVEEKHRSRMNITLRVGGPNGDKKLEEKFIEEASLRGMLSLKGHRCGIPYHKYYQIFIVCGIVGLLEG